MGAWSRTHVKKKKTKRDPNGSRGGVVDVVPRAHALVPGESEHDSLGRWGSAPPVHVSFGTFGGCLGFGWGWGRVSVQFRFFN